MSTRRKWQLFVAAGEDDAEQLPIESSPWHNGRWVRIPREHWDLILDFAKTLDRQKAENLESYSWAADDNADDYIYDASAQELMTLLPFMSELAYEIESADPLVSEATEEVPDLYVNEEHVRMIQAVAAIFRESIRLCQPFRAWVE